MAKSEGDLCCTEQPFTGHRLGIFREARSLSSRGAAPFRSTGMRHAVARAIPRASTLNLKSLAKGRRRGGAAGCATYWFLFGAFHAGKPKCPREGSSAAKAAAPQLQSLHRLSNSGQGAHSVRP